MKLEDIVYETIVELYRTYGGAPARSPKIIAEALKKYADDRAKGLVKALEWYARNSLTKCSKSRAEQAINEFRGTSHG